MGLYYCWRHPGFKAEYKVLPPECDPATHSPKEQIEFQKKQIAELISKYPDVFYIWNDGLDPDIMSSKEALDYFRSICPGVLLSANWWDWNKKGTPFVDIAVKEMKGYGPGTNQDRSRNAAGPAFNDFDAFLAACPEGRPFCFWYGSQQPHRPYPPGIGIRSGMDPAKVFVPPYLPDNAITRSDICDYLQQVDPTRDHILTGMERHVRKGRTDGRQENVGYPIRTMITKDFHYLRNFRHNRWPAGDPPKEPIPPFEKVATDTYVAFSDCDSSPTKAFLVTHREETGVKPFADRAFGKRPARELYDLRSDPYELKNVAEDPAYADIIRVLVARLMAELRATGDPRAFGGGDRFDAYTGKRSK